MGFLSIIKAIDEFVYEMMSWLVFYPLTLWRTLRHPLEMMEYADSELDDRPEERYTDTLSPPLFLLVSLLLSHGIELSLVGQNELVGSKSGLSVLVTDDTSLIVLRLLLFSAFPMMFALRLIMAQRVGVTRKSLREPFYSQCYVAAPFALALGLGTSLSQLSGAASVMGAILAISAILAYAIIQARWFARHLQTSSWRGSAHAALAMILGFALIAAVAVLLR